MCRNKRFTIIGVVGLALLVGVPLLATQTSVEVESDTLQINNAAKTAIFKGNVRAKYGSIRFRCAQMDVSYTEAGNLRTLVARGNVVVQKKGAHAKAAKARLDAVQGVLVLEGSPVLMQGKNRLEGESIRVHLASGKVDVVNAKGVFVLGGKNKGSKGE